MAQQSTLSYLFSRVVVNWRKTKTILSDCTHPLHSYFQLLPFGSRFRLPTIRSYGFRNPFILTAISLLNAGEDSSSLLVNVIYFGVCTDTTAQWCCCFCCWFPTSLHCILDIRFYLFSYLCLFLQILFFIVWLLCFVLFFAAKPIALLGKKHLSWSECWR